MSEIRFRDLEEKDFDNVSKALRRCYDKGKTSKQWIDQNWNTETNHQDFYTRHIFEVDYFSKVIVNEAYLILYTSGPPWHDPTKIMLEAYLVLRIGPGSNFDEMTEALEQLAIREQCDFVCVGTALTGFDDTLVKRYLAHDYTKFETILHKKINWRQDNERRS